MVPKQLVDRRADHLEELSNEAADVKAKLTGVLGENAASLREPKPRLMLQRAPNPFLVAAAALALGILAAKLVDWRGHAHPRG